MKKDRKWDLIRPKNLPVQCGDREAKRMRCLQEKNNNDGSWDLRRIRRRTARTQRDEGSGDKVVGSIHCTS